MQLLAARLLTITFLATFGQVVTTPSPTVCAHDCGEVHLVVAGEHTDHAHDAGTPCHDDEGCLDTLTFETLLPAPTRAQIQPTDSAATTAVLAAHTDVDSRPATHRYAAPRSLPDPFHRLARLLI